MIFLIFLSIRSTKAFIKDFIYADRDDFTTNRESAIIFSIPSCFIEGLLVVRKYEKDNEMEWYNGII